MTEDEMAFHIRWPKYWSFSFSISLSSKYSGLISFRIDWFESSCCPRDSQESSPTPHCRLCACLIFIEYCPVLFEFLISYA